MRAKKREKNAPRELARLKKILECNKDVVMDETMCTVVDSSKLEKNAPQPGKL